MKAQELSEDLGFGKCPAVAGTTAAPQNKFIIDSGAGVHLTKQQLGFTYDIGVETLKLSTANGISLSKLVDNRDVKNLGNL